MKYYKRKYKYTTAADEEYATGIQTDADYRVPAQGHAMCILQADGRLWISRSYAWDGPSGPTIDTKSFMRASLVHDALYQLLRETDFGRADVHEERRKLADDVLLEICIADGMWKWRARWVYAAVRAAGEEAARPKVKKVYEAP